MSKSVTKFDLCSFSNVLRMTKIDPYLPARLLRSLLENCLPNYFLIDAKFLDNFRQRCQLYHATHSVVSTLERSDAVKLTSTDKISDDECKLFKSFEVMANIFSIYASIMQMVRAHEKLLPF